MTISYAQLCTDCDHLGSSHLWDHHEGGTLVDGPYRCEECGCEQPQRSSSFVPLTKRQYEDWKATHVGV